MLRFFRWSLFFFLVVLCIGVAGYSMSYLLADPNIHNPFVVRFAEAGFAVSFHFFFGATALLLVPFQASARFRNRWTHAHRALGGAYIGCVLLSGVSGLIIAQGTHTGFGPRLGFSILSLLWLGFTARAVWALIAKDIANHRRWMIRSMALTTSAITLRVILGLGFGVFGFDFPAVYAFASWASWLINLVLIELYLRWPPRSGFAAKTRSVTT